MKKVSNTLNQKRIVVIVYIAAMFMAAMDGTIVNVALATISKEFAIPASATGGVNVGYLVSLALVLPIAGWLGDRFGTKKIFLLALGIFTISSILCGFANSMSQLNVFRVFQGAAGGLLTPVGMAMLFRTFPPEERVRVSRMIVLPIAIAPALGPIIGGFIVEYLTWRWVFFINLPIGIAALLFGILYLAEHKEPHTGRLDLFGFFLSAPGLALLMYALNQGPAKGWSSPVILITGISGLILFCLFVWAELRIEKPMLNLRLLSEKLFRKMLIISFFSSGGLLGILFVFPLMYQNAFHASALASGMTTFPEALGLMIASRMMPWTSKKIGARQVIWLGIILASIVLVLLGLSGSDTSPWFLRFLLFSFGIFLGHTVVTVQASVFTNIPSLSMGQAATLFNVQNRLGSAIAVAILASMIGIAENSVMNGNQLGETLMNPYQFAMFGSAGFLLAALLFALTVRKKDLEKITPKTSVVNHSENRKIMEAAK